jgi:hypothetical protein
MTQARTPAQVQRILAEPVAAPGGIGFIGADVPVEVLLASGRAFGHLPWSVGHSTPWADRWLESSFPFWARSILEQWHVGAFDGLDAVVISRADDASQRLFYYVGELQRRDLLRGPKPVMFDIALVRRDSSIEHTAQAVLLLCRSLGIDPDLLERAIERANTLRQKLAAIDAARHGDGPLYERIARAALWSDPLQWLDQIAMPTRSSSERRVMLAGSFPPDDRIHQAVEAGGASVVAESHVHRLDRLGREITPGAQRPELAIARQLQSASTGARAMLDRAGWILERARAARAQAVVIWLTREDEALAWHVPAQSKALSEAGIPTLVLSAAHWLLDDPARIRLEQFLTGDIDATA